MGSAKQRLNYVARAIIEAAERKEWRSSSKKGNYRVEMVYDGQSMMCSFYYKDAHIADWYSLPKMVVIHDVKYKKPIVEGILAAGYKVDQVTG